MSHVQSQLKQSQTLHQTQLPPQGSVHYQPPPYYHNNSIPFQSQYLPNSTLNPQSLHNTQTIHPDPRLIAQHSSINRSNISYNPYPGSSDPNDCDCLIHCPVCNINYHCNQLNHHMRRHYVADQYDFNSDKDLSNTNDSFISNQQTTTYPLIEPLEFNTKELDEVAKGDRYKFIINENYDDFAEDHEPTEK